MLIKRLKTVLNLINKKNILTAISAIWLLIIIVCYGIAYFYVKYPFGSSSNIKLTALALAVPSILLVLSLFYTKYNKLLKIIYLIVFTAFFAFNIIWWIVNVSGFISYIGEKDFLYSIDSVYINTLSSETDDLDNYLDFDYNFPEEYRIEAEKYFPQSIPDYASNISYSYSFRQLSQSGHVKLKYSVPEDKFEEEFQYYQANIYPLNDVKVKVTFSLDDYSVTYEIDIPVLKDFKLVITQCRL